MNSGMKLVVTITAIILFGFVLNHEECYKTYSQCGIARETVAIQSNQRYLWCLKRMM